jgi:predicted 3-demethylubiquinone-9 3-methyltransferase (glyoxalase superfamily)
MKKYLTTCLWFDGKAEEAAHFYASVFKDVKIGEIARYTEAGKETHGQKPGSVMTAEWEMFGQNFIGLNGGPLFKFSEAFSLQIHCDTQDEIDMYWDKLIAGGGEPSMCGWLKDKFGFSWQVTYVGLEEMMKSPDIAKKKRATDAMMKMRKLDVAALEKAYAG